MRVRGTAYLARQAFLVRHLGQAGFDNFLHEFAQSEPLFKAPIYPISYLPADAFMRFNDRIVERFFGSDPEAFWRFGEDSAEWSFKDGPNKRLYSSQSFVEFTAGLPIIWRAYFDAGAVTVVHGKDGVMEIHIKDVPLHHVYFEASVLGYVRRGLVLTGASSVALERVKGFSAGDDEIHYRVRIG